MKIKVQDIIIDENRCLRDALLQIDKTAQGIIFVVNESGVMVGILTDGDTRRAILSGASLDQKIKSVMKTDFFSLPVSATKEEIFENLKGKISHIPLLDVNGKPADFSSVHQIRTIPIMEPFLGEAETKNVMECLKTNWISSQGKFVNQFENDFVTYHGGGHALTTSNGTTALHLAMVALGIGKGDEVIVPDLTFAASINSVLYTGATPVIVDVDPVTWTLSEAQVRLALTPKTKAIMPVHLYGHPAEMDPLLKLAKEKEIYVIEDCAESVGARYKEKLTGTLGDAGCFSFFGNKLITTGEGGMILFKDKKIFEKAKCLRDHGMNPQKRYWHDEVGFNYRLTNLQAAVGVAQLEKLDSIIERKLEIAHQYEKQFKNIPSISLPPGAHWAKSVYWLYTVLIDEDAGISRDDVMNKLLQNGVDSRPVFYPLHEMKPYLPFSKGRKFPNTEKISRWGISLPSAVTLSLNDVERIGEVFARIFDIKKMVQTAKH